MVYFFKGNKSGMNVHPTFYAKNIIDYFLDDFLLQITIPIIITALTTRSET